MFKVPHLRGIIPMVGAQLKIIKFQSSRKKLHFVQSLSSSYILLQKHKLLIITSFPSECWINIHLLYTGTLCLSIIITKVEIQYLYFNSNTATFGQKNKKANDRELMTNKTTNRSNNFCLVFEPFGLPVF